MVIKVKEKILITGASGFIGSNLSAYLSKSGYEIYHLKSDITLTKLVIEEVKKVNPSIVIHCAAIVGTEACDQAGAYCIDVNVKGSYNISQACKIIDSKLIYIGTTASYYPSQNIITENTPSQPKTLYGLTKYFGELLASNILNRDKLLILRFCFAYGKNDYHSGIHKIIDSWRNNKPCILLMDENNFKDYQYVDDFCEAVKLAIEKKLVGFYNVSFGKPKKLKEIINVFKDKFKINPVIYCRSESDYLGSHVVDSTKFRLATGWRPKISLLKGIKLMLNK